MVSDFQSGFSERKHNLLSKRPRLEEQADFSFADLKAYLAEIPPLDTDCRDASYKAWNGLCKPLHCLGILEDIIAEMAGMQGEEQVNLRPAALFCFAADNGIVEAGVSQSGQEITAQVLSNMAAGQATVAIFCRNQQMDFYPVHVGASHYKERCPGVIDYPICPQGTRNFLKTEAMTEQETLAALQLGISLADLAHEQGYKLVVGGEMGIGNTTTSTALATLLLDLDPFQVTGRGAGLSDTALLRKKQVIQEAKIRYASYKNDPFRALSAVGGLDIASLAGLYLGAAHNRMPVILDGLISYAAALVACRLAPQARAYLLASHLPQEAAGQAIASDLKLRPFLDLGLSLGEGAGALFLLPLLDMAVAELQEMPSWDDGKIEAYEDYQEKHEVK
ncbi:MAG: nicotinate-nucleotide--dimethylbenzimidazole phosphoribosyltransferase [Eubacteriales bacterium]|nr:nicotinate-nucleotide--dimethylbenzimidazole phosphoribosyltransferase [Eubacteriales bacterium]